MTIEMNPLLADLLQLLRLERLEENIFRGESRDIGGPRVFGGQVLGQALTAATYTVDGRDVHSLHAYFLRAGDVKAPIIYEVDRARDGKSFSNRRVVAIQHGRPIFSLTASFQKWEEGLEHQVNMPDVPAPDTLGSIAEIEKSVLERLPDEMCRFFTQQRPFEIRPVDPVDLVSMKPRKAQRYVWIRSLGQLPEDPDLHRNLLAYISDYQLVGTATLPHAVGFSDSNVQMASLDHAMWFHRPFRVDQWLLYTMESPNASGARGLALGRFFTTEGVLVASAAQEGLVRIW